MKIAYICRHLHRDRGAPENYVLQMAAAMARRDHQVHIIAEDRGEFFRQPLHQNIHLHHIKLAKTPYPGFWTLDQYFPLDDQRFAQAAARLLLRLCATDGLDIVEGMDYSRNGAVYAPQRESAFVLRLHGWLFNRSGDDDLAAESLGPKEKRMKTMAQSSFTHADAITAVSADFAESAKKVWSLGGQNIRVIPNAVDVSLYQPNPKIPREKSVIFASPLTEGKGICTLAEAMPKIIEEVPDVHFYIAGKNMPVKDGTTTAKDYVLHRVRPSYVTFLGELGPDDLIAQFQRALIAVFPSRYEPFGMAALEAMACGCATVVTDVGGFRDLVAHAQNGLRIPVQAPLPLARAVIRFLSDPSFAMQCRDQAVSTVRSRYTVSHLTAATEDVYSKAIYRFRSRRGKGHING